MFLNQPLAMVTGEGPKLVILEEPVEKFRFRYKSELQGKHVALMGSSNGNSKKTFPTVELRGYDGRAVIRCSLYQTSDTLVSSPHFHKLVVRGNDIDVCDAHDLRVSKEDGYKAVFQRIGIIHTTKRYIIEELVARKIREKQFEEGRPLTPLEESTIKVRAEKEAKAMNLNQVRLAFTAYAINPDESWSFLCGPVFSRCINNMNSALTGELKISRLSSAVSSAAGGDDLILLVEKVGKKNIKVKFYEVDEDGEVVWTDWGLFSEADVHHQYAIALRTPPYTNKDIDKHVDVFIQLLRPTDGDVSEPVPFRYKPREFTTSRKRARTNSSELSSGNIPETVMSVIKNSPQASNSQGFPNKSDVIDEFLGNLDQKVLENSDELFKLFDNSYLEMDSGGKLEKDGASAKVSIELNSKKLAKLNVHHNSSELLQMQAQMAGPQIQPQIGDSTMMRSGQFYGLKAVVQLLLEHGTTSGPNSSGSSASPDTPMDIAVTPKTSNTDESSEEEDDRPLQIDEFSMEDNDKSGSLLDDECIDQLTVIFDKDNKWRNLAKIFKFDSFIDIWKTKDSPSRKMLNYLNVFKIKTQKIVSAMELLNEQDAVNKIDEMLNRKKTS